MKLILTSMTKEKMEIEISENSIVGDICTKMEEIGKFNNETEELKLIHNGKLLLHEQTLEQNNIKDNSIIIYVRGKKKQSNTSNIKINETQDNNITSINKSSSSSSSTSTLSSSTTTQQNDVINDVINNVNDGNNTNNTNNTNNINNVNIGERIRQELGIDIMMIRSMLISEVFKLVTVDKKIFEEILKKSPLVQNFEFRFPGMIQSIVDDPQFVPSDFIKFGSMTNNNSNYEDDGYDYNTDDELGELNSSNQNINSSTNVTNVTNVVTEEDEKNIQEILNEIKNMGMHAEYPYIVQSYFACNKNREHTINFVVNSLLN